MYEPLFKNFIRTPSVADDGSLHVLHVPHVDGHASAIPTYLQRCCVLLAATIVITKLNTHTTDCMMMV